eukprot:TRINITY_DN25501_c0_g1_i1.p1 TRINITY_DN25501_c0_g1~~TRINITY_DN25501_c0_g1_i1.p1  ORF type:complete len:528 (+),score=139.30 TRINITY_DN25501_c0_g1_i1:41-1624(+)
MESLRAIRHDKFLLQVLLIIGLITLVCSQRFEFKHSFKAPFYLTRGGYLPFWEYGGSTAISEQKVRLTPVFQSRIGYIWNSASVSMDNWEVIMEFKVGGGGKYGADGLAFWYTQDSKKTGPVFGSKDYWKGLALIFDSFDNDQRGDNPKIYAIYNDGSKSYDAGTDGANLELGHCLINYRNRHVITRAKIRWLEGVLKVDIDNGSGFESCIEAQLPSDQLLERNWYYGLSAATGELFDNHDVISFLAYNLDPYSNPLPDQDLPVQPKTDDPQPTPQAEFKTLAQKLNEIRDAPEQNSNQNSNQKTNDYRGATKEEFEQAISKTQQGVENVIKDHVSTVVEHISQAEERDHRILEALARTEQLLQQHSSVIPTQMDTVKSAFIDTHQNLYGDLVDQITRRIHDQLTPVVDEIQEIKSAFEKDINYLRTAISDIKSGVGKGDPTTSRIMQGVDDLGRKWNGMKERMDRMESKIDERRKEIKEEKAEEQGVKGWLEGIVGWVELLVGVAEIGGLVWWVLKRQKAKENKHF